jgi:hypothetical protein
MKYVGDHCMMNTYIGGICDCGVIDYVEVNCLCKLLETELIYIMPSCLC